MPDLFGFQVPAFVFAIGDIAICLSTTSGILRDLHFDYFRYYQPEFITATALPLHNSTLTIKLDLQASLSNKEQLLPPTKLLLSQAGQVSLWQSQSDLGEQFHLETDTTLFSVDPANGRMTGIVAEAALDSPNLLVNTYTFAALMLMMRWHGYYHLHTAAVLSPRQGLHLICGSQRAGKTTLATALGIAGWQTISDDGVLLRQDEQGLPSAQAFKRDFHLTRALLEKWPELNALTARYTYHDRACIDGLELFHTRQLADLSCQQVASVIFPEISGQPQSRLESLSPSEAIHKLIEQSMFFPLWAEHTQKQITLLTNLVKGASFYRLLAGTDIWADPHQASLVLDSRTANSPCHEK